MFGFSLPKIAFLFLIIFIIWQIFRIIEKRQSVKDESNDNKDDQNEFYEPLIECSKCGNFYSKDSSRNCPICSEIKK